MSRRRERAVPLGAAVAAFTLALLASPVATAGDAAANESSRRYRCATKPLVIKIHADWCGTCRATQATWDRVVGELADRATMVTFDVTDRASYESAKALAARLEIGDVLHDFRRRTGAIAVLDCDSRKPREVLSGERDFARYREAVEAANPAAGR